MGFRGYIPGLYIYMYGQEGRWMVVENAGITAAAFSKERWAPLFGVHGSGTIHGPARTLSTLTPSARLLS
jgi:hypothetical protein